AAACAVQRAHQALKGVGVVGEGNEVVVYTAVYHCQIALPGPAVAVMVSGHRFTLSRTPEMETAVAVPHHVPLALIKQPGAVDELVNALVVEQALADAGYPFAIRIAEVQLGRAQIGAGHNVVGVLPRLA